MINFKIKNDDNLIKRKKRLEKYIEIRYLRRNKMCKICGGRLKKILFLSGKDHHYNWYKCQTCKSPVLKRKSGRFAV
jgi:rRNA maturation endonuclease Nob1